MPMSDARLFALARSQKEALRAEQAAEIRKKKLTSKIVAELRRRGTKRVEAETGGGVTAIYPTETRYDFEYLAGELPIRKLRAIQKREVDPVLLAEEVQAGRIDPALVAAATIVKDKSPYVSVTLK